MTAAYIFDTELTDRKDGEIIEAAWLKVGADLDLFPGSDRISPTLQVDTLHVQRYKPSKPITHGAMAVHHILPHELQYCPPSSTFHLPEDMAYMIGQSIDTDWVAAGSPKHVKRIDTHGMAQHTWPEASGYGQVALMYRLFGEVEEVRAMVRSAHGAAVDIAMNRLILREILRVHAEVTTWADLHAFSEECRIPLTCPLRRWEGVKLEDMDDGAVSWCLNQSWLDPYFRKGLIRVTESRCESAIAAQDFA